VGVVGVRWAFIADYEDVAIAAFACGAFADFDAGKGLTECGTGAALCGGAGESSAGRCEFEVFVVFVFVVFFLLIWFVLLGWLSRR
jgi:hypothetical protein